MNQSDEMPESAANALEKALGNLHRRVAEITPAARAERAKAAAEQNKRHNEEWIESLIRESKAPLRQLYNRKIERTGAWAQTEAKIVKKLGTGCMLGLIGNRGCGKTQLAVQAIRTCTATGRRARYCTATELFIEIKAAYGTQGRSEKDVLNEFSRPLLLVIDEIGQRSESEWENRLLFELLNRRYNALKDTILVTNQSAEEFSKSMGPSLISRLIETGGLIECNWKSYRKQ